MASKVYSHNDYTVGLVCALPKEQTAAIAMLDQRHDSLANPVNDHNAYTLGCMSNHNVVIACLPKGEIGTSSAATVATRMISTFPSIRFGLMVGIGGGVPPNVRLGDVVVSTPAGGLPGVIQWDMGKAEQMNHFRQTGTLNNPPSALLTAVTRLESKHEMEGSAISQYLEDMTTKYPKLALKYTKPDSLEDVCFEAGYNHVATVSDPRPSISNVGKKREYNGQIMAQDLNSCRGCDRRRALKRPPHEMTVHYGLIASGNQVIKDAAFRDQINARLGGGVLCFEMEAAGLMNGFPCAVIRGICDYCDSHKNDVWQEHAAAVAAAFTKELLSVIPPAQVVDAPTAGKVMQSVAETVDSIRDDVSVIRSDVHTIRSAGDEEYRKTLRGWLSPIDYDKVQSDVYRNCQEGTGQWFLSEPKFTAWVSGSSSQTLFCPGSPGAGKTVIASLVVNHLRSRYLNYSTSKKDRVGVAVLYCNYQKQSDQASHDLLASLLSQLSVEQDIIPASIQRLHDRFGKGKIQFSPRDIFEELCSAVTGYSTAFLVIDALDECKDDATRRDILEKTRQLQQIADIRLMLTSRPNILPNRERMMQLPIHASEEDLQRYITSQLGHLSVVVERDPILQIDIKVLVSQAAAGMFLLAQLYMDSLKGKNTKKAIYNELNKMETGHTGLDQAYRGAFQRIESSLSRALLSWVVCAKRLLTVNEMQHALAIEPKTSTMDLSNICDLREVVSGCGGLVVLDSISQSIRLVHQTAKDYFKANISEHFPDARNDIAVSCLTYLSYEEMKIGACPNQQLLKRRLSQFPFLHYASRFWVYHWDRMENKVEGPALKFLLDQGLVCAAGQCALVTDDWEREYSQGAPNPITGMHLAAAFDLHELVPRLSERLPLDSTDNSGGTPLHYATKNGNELTVQCLLDCGADLNLATNSGSTALHIASMEGYDAIVALLIERGADVNCRDSGGGTPLTWAIDKQSETVVNLLFKNGAQMEFLYCPFFQYSAPLPSQLVVESSNANGYDTLRRLRALSAFVSSTSNSNTADEELDQKISPCRYERRIFLPPQFLSQMDFHDHPLLPDGMKSLVADYYEYKRPGEPSFYFLDDEWSVDDLFFTPLLRAVWRGNHRIVQLLLKKGCSPSFGNSRGVMPLELAKRLGDNTSIRIIMSFWNQPEQLQAGQLGLTKLH